MEHSLGTVQIGSPRGESFAFEGSDDTKETVNVFVETTKTEKPANRITTLFPRTLDIVDLFENLWYHGFVRIYGIVGIIEFMALEEEGENELTFQEALINSHHTFYNRLERILSGTK
ncbi:hypothetical protein WN51_07080 [Melipona quadrifasciata]|uniref:Uncharacterized protein n=1 Tax=Melipona quadrifasciata TaxID=166423 RepID=A0A0N0BC12_9HYME|nr:hypothetical protein WN51_07080 [Melipona quadrifasciata]